MMNIEGMQALTLEQMQKMNGQPVWYQKAEKWFIIELHHPDFGECVVDSSGYYIPLEKASKREFYAYPPVTIDREALSCAGCDYLDRDNVPCACCVRSAGYADYYKPQQPPK